MKFPSFLLLISFVYCLCPSLLTAQIDSLEAILATQTDRSERLLTLNELVRQHIKVDPEKGLEYATEANELADAEGTAEERYNSHFLYARLCVLSSMRLAEAEAQTKQAIAISRDELEVPRKTLSAEIMLGGIYYSIDDYVKALKAFTDGAATAKVLDDTIALHSCLNNIASIYRYQGDTKNAEIYYRKCLPLIDTADLVTLAQHYSNIGMVVEDGDEGLRYLKKAFYMYQDMGAPPIYLADVGGNVGNKLLDLSRYEEALPWLDAAIKDAKDYPDSSYYFSALAVLGECNWQLGKQSSAIQNMEAVQAYFQRQGEYWNLLQVEEALANFYDLSGRDQEAYDLILSSLSIKDSINNERNAAALAESNVRFSTAEREATIAAQKLEIAEEKNARSRFQLLALLGLALVAAIFQYFFYRQRRRKAAVELALAAEARETTRLRELDEMKTKFFTNVSHELRTPLTLIISPLEQVIGKLKQTNLKPDLELAQRNSQQLLGLVNEMLDLAKLEAGSMDQEQTSQPLLAWLRRTFAAFESAANTQQVAWNFAAELPEELLATIDFGKLEKIVNNLLSNALKFTPAGARVSLTGGFRQGQLTLEVTDTGPGIAATDLPRIFDRFYQSADLPAAGGTGIGLALSRRLARLLGGDLTVKSEVGVGSQFQLLLPLEVASVAAPKTTVPEDHDLNENAEEVIVAPLSIMGDRPRLLIVEDHPEMSVYLRESLVQEYDGTVAANGVEALQLLEEQSFDLILSDVMMPIMDGFTLRQKINEREDWAGIPFIYLTARTLEQDKLLGFKLGVDDYVTKPFQLPELKARMQSLLSNKAERAQFAGSKTAVDDEAEILRKAEALVRERMDDLSFTVEEMAKELGYSQRQLSRIFGRLTGLTPVKFVLEVRLQHARHLLETKAHPTVAEVRYAIGIESASYFTRKFKERFGRSPSEY
ncbi:MAG: ATP-binding protein [Bacteroidota bacterium]